MGTTLTKTCVDEDIVVYILVAKLAEGMASCLMLQNSTRVVRISSVLRGQIAIAEPSSHICVMPPYSVVLGTIIISVWFRLF